jgi:flagellar biosynthetic protein FliR
MDAGAVLALSLATCRVAGVATFAPVVAGAALPVRVRLAIAFVLAAAAMPAIAGSGVPEAAVAEPWRLLPAAALEFALGAVIGTVSMLPVAAFGAAGAMVGMQAGTGFGQLYDGTEGDEGDAFARLLGVLGTACFVWAGGLDAVALSAARSFDYVALGAWAPGLGVLGVVTGALLASCELAFRVALPVTAVLLAESLVSGLVARSVPGMAPLAFGFPLRFAVALLALLAGAAAMQSAMSGAVSGMLDAAHALVKGGAA